MSGEVPLPDDVTAPWWEGTRERRLLLQRCTSCAAVQHPPRALCAACGDMAGLEWVQADGAGVVDACTVVHRAPTAGHEPPYVVARVRLREGPVLLTNVVGVEPDDVRIDQRVVVDWRPLPDGRALPVFRPAAER